MVRTRQDLAPTGRNTFLDTVRAVALVRVMLWHTYGHPAITVALAAMPAMFFVSGSLYARTRERRPMGKTLWRRLRRILLPLWLFTYVAFAHQALVDYLTVGHLTFEWWRPLQWALPVTTPFSPHVDGAWWGSHLWYLRCFVYLLLAAPLLLWLWRKSGLASLALPVAALAAFQWVPALQSTSPAVQDFVLYAFFWMLGHAYNDGRLARLSTQWRLACTIVFAVLAAVWWTASPPPFGFVNASYQAHLLVGLAWLFAILTLEGPIGRLGAARWSSPVVFWVSSRAVTFYLWHVIAVWMAWSVASRLLDPLAPASVSVLVMTVVFTVVFTVAFGWLEDIAAGRQPHVWPRRTPQPMEIPPLVVPVSPTPYPPAPSSEPVLVRR